MKTFIRATILGAVLTAGGISSWGTGPSAWAQGAIRDTEIEAVMRRYADPLFTAAGLNANDVEIVLIGDRSINAFATLGPLMGIHTGLINEAEFPNEIKGVIAHETGHIAGGHSVRSGEASGAATATTLIALGLGILAIAAGAPDAGAALIASGPQFGQLSVLGYSREQESRADQAGAGFLEATGQSGKGLVRFFERFRYQESLSSARRSPYFRSHPLSSDRVEALAQRVENAPSWPVEDSPEEIAELHMVQAKLHGFLDSPQETYNRYPIKDQSLPARYARAIADYRIPETRLALAKVEELITEQPDVPWFHELKGQILFEAGRTEESIAPHRRALELHKDAPLLMINLARSLLATEERPKIDEAMALLNRALQFEPDNAFAWEQLAIAHDRRGEIPMAKLATAEQAFYLRAYPRAFQFAESARRELKPGTVAYRRAADIVVATRPRGRNGEPVFPDAGRVPPGGGRVPPGAERRQPPSGDQPPKPEPEPEPEPEPKPEAG